MNPILHSSNTKIFSAPRGQEDHCEPLGVTECVINGVKTLASFWVPSPEELELLNANGRIVLYIAGVQQPMVALGVHQP